MAAPHMAVPHTHTHTLRPHASWRPLASRIRWPRARQALQLWRTNGGRVYFPLLFFLWFRLLHAHIKRHMSATSVTCPASVVCTFRNKHPILKKRDLCGRRIETGPQVGNRNSV